ncbi:hypothetical protein RhiirA4_549274 [Rhizophagus irregularis]|uniref:Uncharacterized protein n=1 Tax=Rhizophagus irregularis TaxID=588596 RepID=A0A2I1HCI4_9GLOM|nr:hypothetical protein RhiirA4_549274 [Rhizophagus irregularis]
MGDEKERWEMKRSDGKMKRTNESLSGVLPTYSVLNKRGVNGIINDLCPRCKTVSEDWDHVWICETNEIEIEDLIKRSICEYEQKLLEENRNEEVNILKEIMFDFIRILEQPSLILIGKKREWELLRGVYNENFNKISKKKDIRKVIENLWIYCYENIRSRIWRKRCEVVADIEKEQGLEKKELKKRKILDIEDEGEEGNNKKSKFRKTNENDKNQKKLNNKRIKLVTKDRMIEGISIKNNWHTIIKLA